MLNPWTQMIVGTSGSLKSLWFETLRGDPVTKVRPLGAGYRIILAHNRHDLLSCFDRQFTLRCCLINIHSINASEIFFFCFPYHVSVWHPNLASCILRAVFCVYLNLNLGISCGTWPEVPNYEPVGVQLLQMIHFLLAQCPLHCTRTSSKATIDHHGTSSRGHRVVAVWDSVVTEIRFQSMIWNAHVALVASDLGPCGTRGAKNIS